MVKIAALALVSDVFAAPNVHTGLSGKLTAAHRRVRAFALAILRRESAHPIQSANLLREITALHPDITALVAESSSGGARGAAARSAAVALVAEVSAAGALASLPANTLPSLRGALGEALADGLDKESRSLQLRLQQHARTGGRRTASKTCRRAAVRHVASRHPSTARVGRLYETACVRFWRS